MLEETASLYENERKSHNINLGQYSMDPSRASSSSSQMQQPARQSNNPHITQQQCVSGPQQPPGVNTSPAQQNFKEVAQQRRSSSSQQSSLAAPQLYQKSTHPPSFASSTAMPNPMFGDFVLHGQNEFVPEDEDNPTNQEKGDGATAMENPVMQPESRLPASVKSHKRRKLIFYGLRYFLIVVIVGVLLLVPAIVRQDDADIDLNDADAVRRLKNGQVVFWTFVWLFISWLGFVLFDLIGLALPYHHGIQICQSGTPKVLEVSQSHEEAHLSVLWHHLDIQRICRDHHVQRGPRYQRQKDE